MGGYEKQKDMTINEKNKIIGYWRWSNTIGNMSKTETVYNNCKYNLEKTKIRPLSHLNCLAVKKLRITHCDDIGNTLLKWFIIQRYIKSTDYTSGVISEIRKNWENL